MNHHWKIQNYRSVIMKKLSGWNLLYIIPLFTGVSVCFTDNIFYGILVFLIIATIVHIFILWKKPR